jgi:hypothetical protein
MVWIGKRETGKEGGKNRTRAERKRRSKQISFNLAELSQSR